MQMTASAAGRPSRRWKLIVPASDSSSSSRRNFFSLLCFVALLRETRGGVAATRMAAQSVPTFRNFSFVVEPDDTVAVQGQNVQLPCKALFEGRVPTVTSWTRYGELLSIWTVTAARRIMLENGSLLIMNFGQSDPLPDVGLYRCVAEMTIAESRSIYRIATPQVKLELANMSKQFEREPRSLTLDVGDTAMFSCKIFSRPAPMYTWWKEGGGGGGNRPIEVTGGGSGGRVRVYPDDGVLEIRFLQPSDFGLYRCRASTAAAIGTRTSEPARLIRSPTSAASVNASFPPPEFVMPPWDTDVREGGTAILFCAAVGMAAERQLPAIVWLKDGSTVEPAEAGGRIGIVGTGSLRISNVTEDDAGTYTCRASNSKDSVDANARLRVLVPPRLVRKPASAVAHKDEDFEFECIAYGVPPPRVYWLKDSEELLPSDYFHIVAGRGLRIMGLEEQDSGIYQCMAESDVGRAHGSAQLVVLAGDGGDPSQPPPQQQQPVPTEAAEAAAAGGGNGTSSTAAAEGGVAAAGKQQQQQKLPAAPTGLVAAATTSSSVSLVWQPPDQDGGAPVAGYHITVKEAVTNRMRAANVTVTSHTWSSLKPDTQYELRVFTLNGAGRQSRAAAELLMRTRPELAVPAAPASFRAVASSHTEIRVSWTAPQAAGASHASLVYKVYYYWRDQSKEQIVSTNSTGAVLENLNVYTDYYVRVAAVNSIGEGVPTDEVVVRTMSAIPGATPQNVTVEATGISTMLIQWQPPPADRHNGIITGYKMRYKERDRFGSADTVTTDGSARQYELANLEPGETYMVRVAATNVNGTGEYTQWYSATTYRSDLDESAAPAKPLYIHTKAFATEMIINWGPPGGQLVVRGYRLGYGEITPDDQWINLDANERYHTLKGLKPTQSYVIQLLAYNRAGQGFPIMAQDYTREQSAGGSSSGGTGGGVAAESTGELNPPMEVKALVQSSTSVLVQWHDSSLGANQRVADNRYYTVKYTPLTGTMRKTKLVNTTDLSTIIGGLRPYTKYEFAVKVAKGKRESLYSFNQRNTTFEEAPSSPPRDLTITASDSPPNELIVSWQPPLKANGRLVSYLVYYATENKPDVKLWVMEAVAGDRLNKRIQRVTPDTTYFFKVEAHNSKGRGPMSQTEVFRTPKADGTGGGGIVVSQETRVVNSGGGEALGDRGRDSSALAADGESGARGAGGPAPAGVSTNTMWIVIGCVGSVTFAAIIALIVVLCRRHLLSPERKNKRAGLKQANKTMVRGALKDPPPDLWIHHELKERRSVGSGGPGGLSVVALGSTAASTAGATAEPDELVPMLDPNQHYTDVEQSMSVCGDTYIESYSSLGRNSRPVFATAHSGLREGMPRAAVQPMNIMTQDGLSSRPVYPRTQYGSGARVYVGDSSVASMSTVSANDVSGLCRQPAHLLPQPVSPAPLESRVHPLRSFNIPGPPATPPCVLIPKHIVRPQPSNSYKVSAPKTSNLYVLDPCENGTLKRALPRGGEVTGVAATVMRPPDVLSFNPDEIDLRKTHSTEQLNEETANLEGIIRDINDLRRELE